MLPRLFCFVATGDGDELLGQEDKLVQRALGKVGQCCVVRENVGPPVVPRAAGKWCSVVGHLGEPAAGLLQRCQCTIEVEARDWGGVDGAVLPVVEKVVEILQTGKQAFAAAASDGDAGGGLAARVLQLHRVDEVLGQPVDIAPVDRGADRQRIGFVA